MVLPLVKTLPLRWHYCRPTELLLNSEAFPTARVLWPEIPSLFSGADPGIGGGLINIFTTGGGYGRGRVPPVTARGSGGALIAPPVESGASLTAPRCASPQPLFAFF